MIVVKSRVIARQLGKLLVEVLHNKVKAYIAHNAQSPVEFLLCNLRIYTSFPEENKTYVVGNTMPKIRLILLPGNGSQGVPKFTLIYLQEGF